MTVTRQELMDYLVDTFGFSHKGCAELVASFFSRPGRNPGTGVPCEITACRVVTFKARPKLRQRCNPDVQDAEA